jgi:hypothetical protein
MMKKYTTDDIIRTNTVKIMIDRKMTKNRGHGYKLYFWELLLILLSLRKLNILNHIIVQNLRFLLLMKFSHYFRCVCLINQSTMHGVVLSTQYNNDDPIYCYLTKTYKKN